MLEEVMQCIKGRRSVRKFDHSRDVEEKKIQTCLEAARWAPSANNRQPWHFLIIRNKEMREKLADLHPAGNFMTNSPVVFEANCLEILRIGFPPVSGPISL